MNINLRTIKWLKQDSFKFMLFKENKNIHQGNNIPLYMWQYLL